MSEFHVLQGLERLAIDVIMTQSKSFKIFEVHLGEKHHEVTGDHVVSEEELVELLGVLGVFGLQIFALFVDVGLMVELESIVLDALLDGLFSVDPRGLEELRRLFVAHYLIK